MEEGKVKYVGVSEMPIPTLRKAHAVCPITAYQMEWSLFTRDVEDELVPTCRELGIGEHLSSYTTRISMRCLLTPGMVAYCPLCRGILTGALKSKDDIPEGDFRLTVPRLNEYFEDNLKLVDVVKEVAAEKGCTPGQVALAWVHAQGEDVFPIPGTKHVDRFEENVAAINVKLTEKDMSKLDGIADKVKGDRVPKHRLSWTFRGF